MKMSKMNLKIVVSDFNKKRDPKFACPNCHSVNELPLPRYTFFGNIRRFVITCRACKRNILVALTLKGS